MSRGPGRVQRSILALIKDEPDGAWTIEDLCRHIYGVRTIEKKHRVAVLRAFDNMDLPQPWYLSRQGNACCLHNPLSLDSEIRREWLSHFSYLNLGLSLDRFKQDYGHIIERARDTVAEATRYHQADELGKLDIEIANQQKQLAVCAMAGVGAADLVKAIAANLKELQARRHQKNSG
jgi:hypothetical protein